MPWYTMGTLDAGWPDAVSCMRASASTRCMVGASLRARPSGACHVAGIRMLVEGERTYSMIEMTRDAISRDLVRQQSHEIASPEDTWRDLP